MLYDEAEEQIEMKIYINFLCEIWVKWADECSSLDGAFSCTISRLCLWHLKFWFVTQQNPLIFNILIWNTAEFKASIIIKFCRAEKHSKNWKIGNNRYLKYFQSRASLFNKKIPKILFIVCFCETFLFLKNPWLRFEFWLFKSFSYFFFWKIFANL